MGENIPVSEHKLFYKKDAFDRLIRHYSQGPWQVYLLSDINYLNGTLLPSSFSFGYSSNGSSINQTKYSERYEYNGYGDIYKIYVNNSSTPITYAFDGFSRISQESNNPIASFNRHYSYNSSGYLSSFGNVQLSYNNKGQLNTFGDIQLAYDNCGNRLTKGNETYTWARGKLLNSVAKNGKTISFTYDYLGRRYQKLVNGNVASTYYYLGNRLIGENRSNDLKLRFIYDETGIVGIYAFDGHGRDYYFHYVKNPFGQIVAITDEEGEIEAQYIYDAWGNHKVLDCLGHETDEGIGVENPIRYKGYYYDDETGLYYLLSRYYDPTVGQFISPDDFSFLSISSASGYHLYAYCDNNPITSADSNGHFALSSFLIGLGIAAGIGALIGGTAYAISEGISYAITREWSWSWGQFVGSVLGGALGGALAYITPAAPAALIGALTGFSSTAFGMMLQNQWENAGYTNGEILMTSLLSGLISAATTAVSSAIKIPGLNSGRGSYSAISKQIVTKFHNGTISRITINTFSKMLTLNLTGNLIGSAVSGAMDAFDINDLYAGLWKWLPL